MSERSKLLLRSKMHDAGFSSYEKLARVFPFEITGVSLSRKVSGNKRWLARDMSALKDILNLTPEEVCEIFLDE